MKKSKLKVVSKPKKININKMYQVKISLNGAPLPIWRRLIIDPSLPLPLLHDVLQVAMGWSNYHLHQFQAQGKRFGNPNEFDNAELQNQNEFQLADLLQKPGDSFEYDYDFGDGWRHTVVLENAYNDDGAPVMAHCIDGRRACPPEDVGGIPGYANFLECIEDSYHPEHHKWLEWIGCRFDADSFDARLVNSHYRLMETTMEQMAELALV